MFKSTKFPGEILRLDLIDLKSEMKLIIKSISLVDLLLFGITSFLKLKLIKSDFSIFFN